MLFMAIGMRHDTVYPGDGDGRGDKGHMNNGLPDQGLVIQILDVDERLEQVDGGDADDRHCQLHLEQVGVYVG